MNIEAFTERVYSFPEPVGYEDVVPYEFTLVEGLTTENIDFITVACGSCTKTIVRPDIKDKIFGEITINKAVKPPAKNLIKTITVYFDPDVPQYIVNGNKTQVSNPEKKFQTLTITGKLNTN
jgi:hypothetical protein